MSFFFFLFFFQIFFMIRVGVQRLRLKLPLKPVSHYVLKASKYKCILRLRSGPKVIKLFFMLNTAKHKIFSPNKFENANNSLHFHIY